MIALPAHVGPLSSHIAGFMLAASLASLTYCPPATAGLMGQLAEHAIDRARESQTAKQFTERISAAVNFPSASSVSFPPPGSFATCSQLFPFGQPISLSLIAPQWKPVALCANSFAVLHSGLSKTPVLVVERLNRNQIADAQDEQRTDEFFPDTRLQQGLRAELSDYAGSGLDRGHLAPAADQPDPHSMAQSFALSNMVPQDPTNNRKIWAKLESDVRKFARRAAGDVFVFSGPLFRGNVRTIGSNKVWVPSHLFKLVYDAASGRAWGYVIPNTSNAQIEKPLDYAEFTRATGWQLLPVAPLGTIASGR